ncbi:MAG: DUF3597 domain-containing protein [Verrucomicrobia bacterium]|nr:DUF3597 domain-containing protein [Verrucomicrobiota bacterium]
MGMFSNLMSKIFSHAPSAPAAGTVPGTPAGTAPSSAPVPPTPTAQQAAASGTPTPTPAAPSTVDVTAILDGLAAKNPEKLDWRKSIVDLLKLLEMDSSFAARKSLAAELHYSGDPNDSAEMNIWLHKQVIQKIAENGGKVPQDLLR